MSAGLSLLFSVTAVSSNYSNYPLSSFESNIHGSYFSFTAWTVQFTASTVLSNSFPLYAATNTIILRHCVTLNIVRDAKLQTHNRMANQPISAVPCVQNHTQQYISTTTTIKINSKCGSPPVHNFVVYKLHQFPCQWHPLHYECSHLFLLWWYQHSVLKL